MIKNINDFVLVALTPEGEDQFKKQHHLQGLDAEVYKKSHFDEATGLWKFTIWEMMFIFGSRVFNGGENMFVNNELSFPN